MRTPMVLAGMNPPAPARPAWGGRPGLSFETVEAFKGYVCLGIAAMHLSGVLTAHGPNLFGRAVGFYFYNLQLRVESFYVLSGFFIAHLFRPEDRVLLSVPRLVARRFFRLAIPYWVLIATVLAAVLAGDFYRHRPPHLPDVWELATAAVFAQDLFAWPAELPTTLWSMPPLFQFYLGWGATFWAVREGLIAAGAVDFQRQTRRIMSGVTTLTVLVSLVLWGFAAFEPNAGMITRWALPRWVWAFGLGALTYWRADRALPTAVWVAAAGAVAVFGVVFEHPSPLKAVACAAVLLAVGRGWAIPDLWATRVLCYIGRRSFSIYLIHGFIGYRVLGWYLKLPPAARDGFGYDLAAFVVAVAASVLAGAVYYNLVERPALRLAGRIRYRTSPSAAGPEAPVESGRAL